MAKLLQPDVVTPESLSDVFEHLSVQVEASKTWKCAFPTCTIRVPRDNLSDLEAFLRSATTTTATTGIGLSPSELAEDIAKFTCVDHREHIKKLFFSDIQDDAKGVEKPLAEQSQVQNDASKESEPVRPLPPSTPARKAPGKGRHMDTYEINTPGTLEDQDDEGYYTMPNGKGKAEKWTPSNADEGFASPTTSDVDSVFDDGSPRGAIDTPGTPYSTDPVSRTLHYGKQGYFNETPTRSRSNNHFAASEPKTKSDEDAVKVQLEDTPLKAKEHINTVEESHNSHDDKKGLDEAPPQTTVDVPEVQVVKEFTIQEPVSEKREHFFRARAIFDEAFSKNYVKTEKRPGRLYIAIDIHDESLKGLFKVGIVYNKNTVATRYTDTDCQRKHSLRFVAVSDQPVLSVRRVEWLVHKELYTYQKQFNCKHCSTNHREWFKIELSTVLDVVNRWIMFTSLARNNKGNAEKISNQMRAFMDRRYDLQSIVEDFILESGVKADQRKIQTFVDVTDTTEYTGAKDVKMMREWERQVSCTQEVLKGETAGAENNDSPRASLEESNSNPLEKSVVAEL